MKNYIPLVHALIDALLFLESASPDEVEPDSAVRCMENITSSVLTLEIADQQALRADLKRIAETSEDSSYATFVHSLPNMLGLARP